MKALGFSSYEEPSLHPRKTQENQLFHHHGRWFINLGPLTFLALEVFKRGFVLVLSVATCVFFNLKPPLKNNNKQLFSS